MTAEPNIQTEFDNALEAGYESLAMALDDLAQKHSLTSADMERHLNAADNTLPLDFVEYYREWMTEGWEPAEAEERHAERVSS